MTKEEKTVTVTDLKAAIYDHQVNITKSQNAIQQLQGMIAKAQQPPQPQEEAPTPNPKKDAKSKK